MIPYIPYIPCFFPLDKADSLFKFLKGLPHERKRNPRNGSSFLRRLSYPGCSVHFDSSRKRSSYEVTPWEKAPSKFLGIATDLSNYAGKKINYLSTIGYENERDHMNWHQHKEDWLREDQSVYVLSFGDPHPVGIRLKSDKNKANWHILYPAHGSLYVLPSSFNVTHEHAVLEDKKRLGLRIAINAKHIPASAILPSEAECVREPGPPRIYNIKTGNYPKDAVYVGRAFGKWPDTPFGNYKRLPGDSPEWKAEIARLMAKPGFHALVESLRGKDLLCWCGPKEESRCHARAWLEIANVVKP